MDNGNSTPDKQVVSPSVEQKPSIDERREIETSLFVNAILGHVTDDVKVVLEYGCRGGRLAKGMLMARSDLELVGVDETPQQVASTLAYVNDERFEVLLPHELQRTVDLVYCIFPLQHLPAIEIRETLQRIHHFLKPDGLFIYCAAQARMALRFDKKEFCDDRFLGVNLQREVGRFFEHQGPLFETEIIEKEEILQRMILGKDIEGKVAYLQHRAFVCRRREIQGPLFNAPFR